MATKHSIESTDPKTEQLLLYVAYKLQDCPSFGSVLLNKALYYIDNISYLKNGGPISSFTYVKQERGPTPNPKAFIPLRERLIQEGKAQMVEVEKFGKIQKRLIPAKDAAVDRFTPEEIKLIDEIILDCRTYNATQISELSHNEISWQLAQNLEELPFNTFLLTKATLEEDDIVWAKDRIRERNIMRNN